MTQRLAAAALFGILSAVTFGQSSTGVITGRVLDTLGQSVAGASVTLIKDATGETRTFTTAETVSSYSPPSSLVCTRSR